MSVSDRKGRERAQRERRIVAAARAIAENEGWGAVTIRRLAEDIEYSQPVLYAHFASRDAIVAAVAVEGFSELAASLRRAVEGSTGHREAPRKAALAYLTFARERRALYDAMFNLRTGLRFARPDTKAELKEAFGALAAAFAPGRDGIEVATETFWAALHGLAELEHSGRIRMSARDERVALVVAALFEG